MARKIKPKPSKPKPIDGLGPKNIKAIRNAVRLIWHRSHAKRLVVQRCTDKDGFPFCEKCKKRVPKIAVDHIKNVGDVDGGFIERMFVPSKYLQGLCKACHNPKTKIEHAVARSRRKAKTLKRKMKDFF